ncbi:MAG: hypothetical protein ABFD50_16745 [Smithella sp.]
MVNSISNQNYYIPYTVSNIEQPANAAAKSEQQTQDFQPVAGSKSANLKASEILPKECKT